MFLDSHIYREKNRCIVRIEDKGEFIRIEYYSTTIIFDRGNQKEIKKNLIIKNSFKNQVRLMIYDSIENMKKNCDLYFPHSNDFIQLFDALEKKNWDISKIEKMKFNNLDLRFNDYVTKSEEEIPFEAHQNLWDLQIVLSGEEYIEYAPLETLTEIIPYDQDKDIAFYSGKGCKVKACRGMGLVFAPWDGHKPGIEIEKKLKHVTKIVVKFAGMNKK